MRSGNFTSQDSSESAGNRGNQRCDRAEQRWEEACYGDVWYAGGAGKYKNGRMTPLKPKTDSSARALVPRDGGGRAMCWNMGWDRFSYFFLKPRRLETKCCRWQGRYVDAGGVSVTQRQRQMLLYRLIAAYQTFGDDGIKVLESI